MYSYSEIEYNFNSTTTSFAILPILLKTNSREESNKQNTPVVIFSDRDKALAPTFSLTHKREKYYWGKESSFNPSEIIMRPHMIYEATEEQLEQSQVTITSCLPSSQTCQTEESEPEAQLRVITPPHKRTVLFSKKITLKTYDLPRWKPFIEISSRIMKDIDE
ncbi:MAG: hypothetical protein AB1585_05985 [Thermodesulfobacteriota bacterium]